MAVRDPEATKARIFAAATEEFAAYGIAGARIDRIAQNARANKQLIYAYFGDKADLFAHVLERKMVEVAESVSMEVDDIDDWVERHFEYHAEHPELLRLLMWEALESPATELRRPEARLERYQQKVANFATAQRNGVVRSDVLPAHLLLLMLGLINWPQATNKISGLILGGGEDARTSPDFRESVKKCARSLAGPQGQPEVHAADAASADCATAGNNGAATAATATAAADAASAGGATSGADAVSAAGATGTDATAPAPAAAPANDASRLDDQASAPTS